MLNKIILLAISLITFSAQEALSSDQPASAKIEPQYILGVATHFAQNKGDLATSLNGVKSLGISSIRDEFYWRRVEKKKGEYRIPNAFKKYVETANTKGIRATHWSWTMATLNMTMGESP